MTIEMIATIVIAVFGSTGFWSWIINKSQSKTNTHKLLLGLAYSEIILRCEIYLQRGYIQTDEYNELHRYLFEPYRALGGNGTAEKLIDDVRALPTRTEGKNEQ